MYRQKILTAGLVLLITGCGAPMTMTDRWYHNRDVHNPPPPSAEYLNERAAAIYDKERKERCIGLLLRAAGAERYGRIETQLYVDALSAVSATVSATGNPQETIARCDEDTRARLREESDTRLPSMKNMTAFDLRDTQFSASDCGCMAVDMIAGSHWPKIRAQIAKQSWDGYVLDTAELYDPTSGRFSVLPNSMSSTRIHHAATLLNDGTVLITGGRL